MSLLEDRAQIVETLMRYVHGVDSGDMALVRDAFWPDATDSYPGFYEGAVAEVLPVIEAMRKRLHSMQTMLSNISIEVAGSSAKSEALSICHHRYLHEGSEYEYVTIGRYIDRHERRAGIWKIGRRERRLDSQRVAHIVQTSPPSSLLQV